MTDHDKYELTQSRGITLNGASAAIRGWKNDFATVATLDYRGPGFEWSWDAVQRVVNNDGCFYS